MIHKSTGYALSALRRGARAAAAAAAFSAAVFVCAGPSSAEVVDRIVAVINDSIITLSELNAATNMAVDALGVDEKTDGKKIVEVKNKVLEGLIDQKLVKHAADNAGIDVGEREIDNAIEDVKRQNGNMTQEALMLALVQSGLTYKEYREQLKEQIRQAKFVNREFRSKITVKPEDIEEYYRKNIEEFYGAPTYRLSMIALASGDESILEKKVDVVRKALISGEDFAEVARQYSDGPNASGGGDLGFVKSGELNPVLEEAALKLKPGAVSEPIARPDGVYLLKLTEPLAAKPLPLEEVSGRIHEKLYKKVMDDRFRFWLQEEKKAAHIDIRL